MSALSIKKALTRATLFNLAYVNFDRAILFNLAYINFEVEIRH